MRCIQILTISYMTVDGKWSQWSPVGDCSVTCGKGLQEWTRKCNSPPPSGEGSECIGQSSQTKECQEQPCPGNFTKLITKYSKYK